ncbi:MAG: VWA domain-containing protein, partial [Pseudomonadota bacterium]
GSMQGTPLEEAVRCAQYIIGSLGEDDHASIVVYDDNVKTLVPASRIGNRRRFLRALADVRSGGCTNLFGGWFEGAGQVARTADPKAICRVLLLSDGCANRGMLDTDTITARCAEMADAGVSTSTYGLGRGFNELLMGEMAKAGQGNAYYGETADDLMEPFQQEFDLLSALTGRHVRMGIETPAGYEISVLNNYANDRHGRTMLPDLAGGAEVWALAKLRIPARALRADIGDTVHALSVSVGFRDADSAERQFISHSLDLPVLDSKEFDALQENEEVRARAQELRSAEYRDAIREASLAGNWDRVEALLDEAGEEAEGNPWLSSSLDALRTIVRQRDIKRTSKEAYYSAASLRTRLSSSEADFSAYDQDKELRLPSFLRRKRSMGKRSDKQ